MLPAVFLGSKSETLSSFKDAEIWLIDLKETQSSFSDQTGFNVYTIVSASTRGDGVVLRCNKRLPSQSEGNVEDSNSQILLTCAV